MKKKKKFTSFILTLIMIFSMSTITFAAETYSITINNSVEGHTYEAYHIFTGDLHEGLLSNIKWGSSITNSHDLGNAATVAKKMDTSYTGEDKITLDDLLEMITLGNPVANSGKTSNPYVISGLKAGYYLVKDKDNSLTGENDSYTEYIIKVVGDVETNPKSDVPEVEKKVKDTNDSEDSSIDDNPWQDSADHDIGDKVPFQLKATLADNVSSYTTYKIVFHDTLSKGLTYNNDAKIYIGGKETKGFTVNATVNADKTTTLTVSCDDVKALGATNNSIITVEYTATLNENANLGSQGNPNEVYLEYSNNPNKSEEGNNETGETPKDIVIVFTYKTIINKVDSDNKPLTGAEFRLDKFVANEKGEDTYKDVKGTWTPITAVKNQGGTVFTFAGLDDGEYRLIETVTPDGYNSIDPIYFTVTAEHDVESNNPALKFLNGDAAKGEIEFADNLVDGSLSADVVNKTGVTLPETGGMGTTVFYVIGGGLVLVAIVLLITKRRIKV